MNKLRLMLAGMSFVFFAAIPTLASADVNDFTITNFQADETLSRSDPQGELHVIEHINVDFTDYNHGILRAIPDSYKGDSLQLHVKRITSDSNAPTQYTTYGSNGNTVLKIGDPSRTVTGPQEYTIDYTLRNVISFYKNHDELYWDVNGDQWSQPFEKVSVTLHLPSGLQQSQKPVCYTGSYGLTTQACTISTTGSTIEAATSKPLLANETLTYVAGFKTGYFKPAPWYEKVAQYLKPILEFAAPVLVLGLGSFLYWLKRGRDAKGTGIIVPQYEAPDGLKPMAVGTLMDFKLDNRDISATIIDLAIRGYIKIVETKQNKLLRKDKLSYNLQLTNADFSQLDANEGLLINALFTNPSVGATVDISALKNKLYETAKDLDDAVEMQLTALGYFRSNPLSAGSVLTASLTVAFVVIYIAGKYIGLALGAGLVVGAVIAYFFGKFMAARTPKGVEAKEHILGLKLYMDVAEKDRIEKLQGPNAPYAENANEPVKTVELFEKLLPYAMALRVEKEWSKQFEDLYTQPPSWYSGNWAAFNVGYLAGSLSGGMSDAINTAFTAPSSSGSSGFGGGFAGGGGGGGGGGGW